MSNYVLDNAKIHHFKMARLENIDLVHFYLNHK